MESITQLSAFIITLIAMLGTLILVPVIPFLPGPVLMWLLVVLYALVDQLATLSWGTLIILTGLMLIGSTGGIWLQLFGVEAGGGTWRSAIWGLLAGIVGVVVFPPFGGVIAAALAAFAMELAAHGSIKQAFLAGSGSIGGWLLTAVVEFLVTLAMLVVFVAAVMLAVYAG